MVRHLILSTFLILIMSCSKNSYLETYNSNNENIFFNTVEKTISFKNNNNGPYVTNVKNSLSGWLNNKIKVNGYDGNLNIVVHKINTEEKIDNNLARFDLEVQIVFEISNSLLSNTRYITLNASEFGELKGSFSLNDKLIMIENITYRLIDRFTNKLISELS